MKKLISLLILATAPCFIVQAQMGIGTNTPAEKLDVVGAIKIGNTTTTNAGTIRWNGTEFQGYDGAQWVSFSGADADWVITGTDQYAGVSGNIGIGTATPSAKLDVEGSVQIVDGNQGAGKVLSSDANGNATWTDPNTLVDGAFATSSNVTSNAPGDQSTDDFVFGSDQLADDGNTAHDARMFFDKSKGAFRVGIAEGTEWDDSNVGNNGSIAMGYNSMASGSQSVAIGSSSSATGTAAISVGIWNTASAASALAVGEGNSVYSSGGYAFGHYNTANGGQATAVGRSNSATGYRATAIGYSNSAALYTTAVGYGNAASNIRANAMGYSNFASGQYSSAVGYNNDARATRSSAFGADNYINGSYSCGFGYSNYSNSSNATAIGYDNDARGYGSTSVGFSNYSSNSYTTAIGVDNDARGYRSTSVGFSNYVTGYEAIAFGFENTASATQSTSIGSYVTASGVGSTGVGRGVLAIGSYSYGFGRSVAVSADNATAVGTFLTADHAYEIVTGHYNDISVSGNTTSWVSTDRIFSVGNGQTSTLRSNALTILKNGNTGIGTVTPSAKLHIGGTAGVDGIKFPDGTMQTTAASLDTDWTISGNNQYSGVSGNVGVGTTTPSAKLHVEGTVVLGVGSDAGTGSAVMGKFSSASGDNAIALGNDANATGVYSGAWGHQTTASGYAALALGWVSTATSTNSVAIGAWANASGRGATALGDNTTAESGYETVVGRYNTDYTPGNVNNWHGSDRLFVVGNGTGSSARSDAMVMLKNGNTGFGTSTPARTVHIKNVMRLEPLATPPSSPAAGDIYFSSITTKLMVYDGTAWQACW